MTAEIAVMNKSGIALAADSAVTIDVTNEQGSEKRRIYNTVNKLFTLSKYEPVGIMVYGNAHLMGVPWEVIIKLYRKHLGERTFDTLEEYTTDFIAYLEHRQNLFSPEAQDNFAHLEIFRALLSLVSRINDRVKRAFSEIDEVSEGEGEISAEEIEAITNSTIENVCNRWHEARDLSGSPDQYREKLRTRYTDFVEEIIPVIFKESPINETAKELIRHASIDVLTKEIRFSGDDISGVVIAGYGDLDIFPVLCSLDIKAVLEGKVQLRHVKTIKITEKSSAAIIPFAQGDMVSTFMEGVDPAYQQMVEGFVSTMIDTYSQALIDSLPDLADDDKEHLSAKLDEIGAEMLTDFENKTATFCNDKHSDPIVTTVAFLPKDELASVAEALVSLTSLKRRVSNDQYTDTVGGPVDVAIISKGDGFVWIKRKHYFKPELNHTFFASYFQHSQSREGTYTGGNYGDNQEPA